MFSFSTDTLCTSLSISNCTGAFTFATADVVSLSIPGTIHALDIDSDVHKVSVENENIPSIDIVVDGVNTGSTNTDFAEINVEGYPNATIQLIGSSDGSGVTFKIYGTLDEDATVPASAASPTIGSNWTDLSLELLGNASGVTLDEASQFIFIDTNIYPQRYIISYDPDNATNSVSIIVQKAKPSS
jgi:hypothetical protein